MNNTKKWSTQKLILTGMLSAVAGVLMSLEFSLPMFPPFYKIDFSDVPSVIAIFLMGPIPAMCVEVIKLVIKVITVGTNSMYVGEVANLTHAFIFVFPVWFLYNKGGRTLKSAVLAMVLSLPLRIGMACFINACITLPLYARAMGFTIDEVVRAVSSVNPAIQNLPTFLVLATIPFNLIKISLNYVVGYFLFDRLHRISFVKTMQLAPSK